MKRNKLTYCQYLGTLVYPGGDEAVIIRYEDGSLGFVPVVKYK